MAILKSVIPKEVLDMKIAKCACGLTMRAKDWAMHWRTCYKGSSVPVTPDDIAALEYHEARRQVSSG